jgi:CheY-like chemotaxis protein
MAAASARTGSAKPGRGEPAAGSAQPSCGLEHAARTFPGAAICIGEDGLVVSASPLSGFTDGMRAPFAIPAGERSFQASDPAGRKWRVSAPSGGRRLAVSDPKEEPDTADRFTASVSHEIRTPLNGILGMASLLDETRLAPDQKEYVTAIRKSGSRLLDLLNNVLDYSRMEQGDLPLEYAPFAPADLVQDVAELLAPRAHSAGLDIAGIVDAELPSRLVGDAGRLRQILFNLTGNAVKFTESGGVLVEARPGPDGTGLSLIVRDTGMGIPEEAKDRLFEAFGQARASDARRDGGVGLGLAIVARLVSAMKGKVSVVSAPGEGALFRVDLPLSADPAIDPPVIIRRRRRPLRVAVQLPSASALAAFAALADEGGLATELDAADVVLMDAASAPAAIRRAAAHRPVLIVLRPEDRTRIDHFLSMGCTGYLIRPLRPASVAERVRLAFTGAEQTGAAMAETQAAERGVVLIADDNAVNALLASRALKAAGYRTETAGTGAEALERASETAYSVIFMDIRMPVMDGIEAARRIRALSGAAGSVPIIALTADVDSEMEARARAAGVNAVAGKPIDPASLRRLADRWSAHAPEVKPGGAKAE